MFKPEYEKIKLVTTNFADGHTDEKVAYEGNGEVDGPAAFNKKDKLYIWSFDPESGVPPHLTDRPLRVVESWSIADWDGIVRPLSLVDDRSEIVISQIGVDTLEKIIKILDHASSFQNGEFALNHLADEFEKIEYEYEPIRRIVAGFKHQVSIS